MTPGPHWRDPCNDFWDPRRYWLEGAWHRRRQMLTVPPVYPHTWCGLVIDDSDEPLPYIEIGRVRYEKVEGDLLRATIEYPGEDLDCQDCAVAAWERALKALLDEDPRKEGAGGS
jgi:hypothetical protein